MFQDHGPTARCGCCFKDFVVAAFWVAAANDASGWGESVCVGGGGGQREAKIDKGGGGVLWKSITTASGSRGWGYQWPWPASGTGLVQATDISAYIHSQLSVSLAPHCRSQGDTDSAPASHTTPHAALNTAATAAAADSATVPPAPATAASAVMLAA
jgi:hypothetical protein